MKLVIGEIGMSGEYSRTIVNLDNISALTLAGSGEDERLLVTFMDGLSTSYMVNNHQLGLPDGHGGIACASPQDVMNAYLEMDMKGADER